MSTAPTVSEASRMDDVPHKGFGLAIAFLFPGGLALWSVSVFVTPLGDWVSKASAMNTSVGGFLLLVLAAVGVGVFLGGLRAIVLDDLAFKKWKRYRVTLPDVDVRMRTSPNFEHVYIDLREQYFRYYQFYGHTLLASPVAVAAAWSTMPTVHAAVLSGVAFLGALVMFSNAYRMRLRYRDQMAKLLGTVGSNR